MSVPDTIQGLFIGSGIQEGFWLYWMTTFTDLIMVLLSANIFYKVARTFKNPSHKTYGRWSSPINIAKLMTMSLMAVIFFRVSIDTIILLTWQETSSTQLHFWQQMNELFDTMALIPLLIFFYLSIRAGPLLEFQLLRQPIPTDLTPSWKMVRGPLFSLLLMVLLSMMVVSTKLLG